MKVLEVGVHEWADVKQVRPLAFDDQLAIFYPKRFGVFVGFPTVEIFAVKELDPLVLVTLVDFVATCIQAKNTHDSYRRCHAD
jgi:hypothetical protein